MSEEGVTGEQVTEEQVSERSDLEAAIEQNPEAVAGFVERLDAVNELLDVLSLGEGALDDEMVASLAGTGAALGEVAQTAADDDTRDGVETLLTSLGEAERQPPERVGPVGLVRELRDPDVQHGFGYLLALAGAIGRKRDDDDGR